MDLLDLLDVLSTEAKSDGNRSHYHIAQEAKKEIFKLRSLHQKLKIYEKIYGKI